MKPRNKYEKRVAEINATLSEDIAVRDIEWVKKQDFGYKNEKQRSFYFTLYTNIKDFEVKRLYRGYVFQSKTIEHYFFMEVMREFSDGNKKLYFGKKRTMGCYYDCFCYNSDMELRSSFANYAGNSIPVLFEISWGSHPQSNGKRVACANVNPSELGRMIVDNPIAENLYKTNDPLFGYLMYRTHLKETCRAITIAKRHGFVFNQNNTSLWLDMVYAMIKCKKDWHNPVYIAPKDLQATHNKFIRMMIRQEEQNKLAREYRKIEQERRQRRELDELYVKNRKKFFGMVLKSGSLEIRVLKSVDEFLEEAEYMQHCVYKCRYWDLKTHPKSLIMSATIGGHKCETIEVNLENYTIAQCFGKHDQFTNYHDRIVDFVNRHMDVIKKYNQGIVKHQKAA